MEHNPKIIGRKYEQEVLQRCVESPRAEFIAVYGRRRIGKTFLVKQYFNDTFDFYISGIYKVPRAEQLKRWQSQLNKYSGKKRARPKDWFEAFDQLCDYLESMHMKKGYLLTFNLTDGKQPGHHVTNVGDKTILETVV